MSNLCALHFLVSIYKQQLRNTNRHFLLAKQVKRVKNLIVFFVVVFQSRSFRCTPSLYANDELGGEPASCPEVVSVLSLPPYLSTPLSRVVQKQHSECLRVPAFLTAKLRLNHNVILCGAEVTLTACSVRRQPLGSDHSQPYNNPVSRGEREHQHAVTHL